MQKMYGNNLTKKINNSFYFSFSDLLFSAVPNRLVYFRLKYHYSEFPKLLDPAENDCRIRQLYCTWIFWKKIML